MPEEITADELFQSTLPYGSDVALRQCCRHARDFNPRSLTGATSARLALSAVRLNFNPRSLTGATTLTLPLILTSVLFQSTLPYGSDPILRNDAILSTISIHAPLRERPQRCTAAGNTAEFQSTLPYGSDNCVTGCYAKFTNFNPRSLTGATPQKARANIAYILISIHAPLRERLLAPCAPGTLLGFQSTLPYGSDEMWTQIIRPAIEFQSTLPYGSDSPSHSRKESNKPYFNPRSLTGATLTLRILSPAS